MYMFTNKLENIRIDLHFWNDSSLFSLNVKFEIIFNKIPYNASILNAPFHILHPVLIHWKFSSSLSDGFRVHHVRLKFMSLTSTSDQFVRRAKDVVSHLQTNNYGEIS
jgi:hypothetical protein